MENKNIKGFFDERPTYCVQFQVQRLNDLTFLNNQEIARVMLAVRDYFFGDVDREEAMKGLNKSEQLVLNNFLSDINNYTEDDV